MAVGVGFKNPVYGEYFYNETNGTVSYTNGSYIGRGVSGKLDISTTESNDLYADDTIAESESGEFASGNMSIESDGIGTELQINVMGAAKTTETVTVGSKTYTVDVITMSNSDQVKEVGVGFIRKIKQNGVLLHKAYLIKRVKFSIPSEEFKTKADKTEWQTTSLEGIVMLDDTGEWKEYIVVSTEEIAKAWLFSKLGISDTASAPIEKASDKPQS